MYTIGIIRTNQCFLYLAPTCSNQYIQLRPLNLSTIYHLTTNILYSESKILGSMLG